MNKAKPLIENWNPKQHNIFRTGPNKCLNACVGSNGGPYDNLAYGLGYMEAALALCVDVERGGALLDLKIYPAIFLMRHSIELYLKGMLEDFPCIWNQQPITAKGHKLEDLWKQLKPLLEKEKEKFDMKVDAIQFIDKCISDIETVDANAQVFRYPNDLKQNPHLLGEFTHINFGVIKEYIDQVGYIFDGWLLVRDKLLGLNW